MSQFVAFYRLPNRSSVTIHIDAQVHAHVHTIPSSIQWDYASLFVRARLKAWQWRPGQPLGLNLGLHLGVDLDLDPAADVSLDVALSLDVSVGVNMDVDINVDVTVSVDIGGNVNVKVGMNLNLHLTRVLEWRDGDGDGITSCATTV